MIQLEMRMKTATILGLHVISVQSCAASLVACSSSCSVLELKIYRAK